jgi:hypothetical protein
VENRKILAILQNQWFKDPKKVKKIIEESDHPNAREWYIKTFLFWGCLTGRRLKQVFGEELIDEIIFEEASPKIGGQSNSCFPADLDHIQNVIKKHEPTVILAFGKIASNALEIIQPKCRLIIGPHPAARQSSVLKELQFMKQELLYVE